MKIFFNDVLIYYGLKAVVGALTPSKLLTSNNRCSSAQALCNDSHGYKLGWRLWYCEG
jgi:hypothetical protein